MTACSKDWLFWCVKMWSYLWFEWFYWIGIFSFIAHAINLMYGYCCVDVTLIIKFWYVKSYMQSYCNLKNKIFFLMWFSKHICKFVIVQSSEWKLLFSCFKKWVHFPPVSLFLLILFSVIIGRTISSLSTIWLHYWKLGNYNLFVLLQDCTVVLKGHSIWRILYWSLRRICVYTHT